MSNHEKAFASLGHSLAVINQKGGVGKSTVTTLLANIFYFHFKLSVTILDADNPQYTIFKRRKKMEEAIDSDLRLKSIHNALYQDREPIQVIAADSNNAEDFKTKLEQAQNQSDIVLIDVAGTMNQQSIVQILCSIEHFFIPIFQDIDTLRSSIEFYDRVKKFIEPNSNTFKSCQFFFNRIPHMNRLGKIIPKLKSRSYLDTKLNSYTVYENKFRNTLFPISDKNSINKNPYGSLMDLSEEILKVLYYSNQKVKVEEPKEIGNDNLLAAV